jgi:hypothetical protein
MLRRYQVCLVLLVTVCSLNVFADDDRRGLADKHAPAGIMGDHLHEPGQWMIEYKYMNMYMDGNLVGSTEVSDADAVTIGNSLGTNFGASPTAMNMEMHMIHLMYGLSEDFTAYTMIMLPSLTMDHIRGPGNPAGPGTPFTTHNSGVGDTYFGVLGRLYQDDNDDVILNLGATAPTGDLYTLSSIPTGGLVAQPLPYPMRLGSGTFNARPGVTWKHYFPRSSFGTQLQTYLPIGRNYRGYAVSEEYRLNTWFSKLITDNIAFSTRVENLWTTDYDGADPESPNALISTNVENFRGGYMLNLGLGVAGLYKGHLLNVEFIPTLAQDVNGIQLGTDWTFVASWSKSFGPICQYRGRNGR